MHGIEMVAVIGGSLSVTAFARRLNASAPLLLVLVGLAISFVPGLPRIELDPELILGLVLPPLLYSASLDSSYQGFKQVTRPILMLGIGLVVTTAFAVALAVHWVLPDLPFPAALVLGAVVAPPDAVTAVSIGRRLGLPRRLMDILTGESLVNDAAALTMYKVAIAATVGATTSLGNGLAVFGVAAVLGVAVGIALAVVVDLARRKLADPVVESVLGLVVPFAAYLLAEHLHVFGMSGSGVLAVVAAGLFLGTTAPHAGYATRMLDRSVWSSIDVLAEALVFGIMGLQLPLVIDGVAHSGEPRGALVLAAAVALVVTIGVRFPWIFLGAYLPGAARLFGGSARRPSNAGLVVAAWTGMRGVVTLAAVSAVPMTTLSGAPFPGRDELQLFAFTVAIGTLLIQGTTLPWLITRLKVRDETQADRDAEAEVAVRQLANDAALARLDELMIMYKAEMPSEKVEKVRGKLRSMIEFRGKIATIGLATEQAEHRDKVLRYASALDHARRELLAAQRGVLVEERDSGRLSDEVMRRVLLELDAEEAAIASSWTSRLG